MPKSLSYLLQNHPPIFIVGCPHSGTSLMQAIIGSHSNIYLVKGETRIFVECTIKKCDQKMNRFYKRAMNNRKNRWVEKTPEHIHCLNAILERCETAKVIIMIRDGRDVVASLYARVEYSLKESVDRWIGDNTIAMNFADHPRVLLIKYEDVILNFKNTMMCVFNFIDEKYEDSITRFHEHQRITDKPMIARNRNEILALREWQISQPLFDGRGRYEHLKKYQYDYVYSRQKEMLSRFGYLDSK